MVRLGFDRKFIHDSFEIHRGLVISFAETRAYLELGYWKEMLPMREAMQERLEGLKAELQKGEAELQKVEAHRTYLRETLLRIGGAVQALEELLSQQDEEGQAAGQNGSAVADKEGVGAERG